MKKRITAVIACICLITAAVACSVAFSACGDDNEVHPRYDGLYTFEKDGDGLVITGVGSSRLQKDVELPTQSYYYVENGKTVDHTEALPVKRIAPGAFRNFTQITSVKIGSSYVELGAGCFEKCTSLKTVIFPTYKKNDVAAEIAIPSDAFKDCNSLRKVEGNPVLTEIGDGAFSSCLDLSVFAPQVRSDCKIGSKAFYYCVSLNVKDKFKDVVKDNIASDAFDGIPSGEATE